MNLMSSIMIQPLEENKDGSFTGSHQEGAGGSSGKHNSSTASVTAMSSL